MKIEQLTNEKWLNLFKVHRDNGSTWTFASRKSAELAGTVKPDAVIVVATVGEKLLITKEFRVPINDYEWGFPAGLIDNGETSQEAAKRELFEETGLTLKSISLISPPIISSPGMSDESAIVVFGSAEGELTNKHQEANENIEAFLFEKKEIAKIVAGEYGYVSAKAWGILLGFVR